MEGNSAIAAETAEAVTADGVRSELERVLASRFFDRSKRLNRFLRFAVEQVLAGAGDQLKEQLIGIEVFDRKADYDPRIDPIVRVEARRLRLKLTAYYTSAGRNAGMFIALPKGSYAPVFRLQDESSAPPRPSETNLAEIKGGAAALERKSIAVLPFANLTPGAGDDYFSDGLAEELIHLLTRIPRFRVVAWESSSQLRGRERDLAAIRENLKVGAILRGSVRHTATRVRVTAQLIDAGSGAYLWSEVYNRELRDVFAIQEEMARAIVNALHVRLAPEREHEAALRPPSLECYKLCLEGRFHAGKRTAAGLHKSVLCFERAIAADGSAAHAHAGLADAYSLLAEYGFLDPGQAVPMARTAAEKALALDPESSEANVSLAFIRSVFDWDWNHAEALYRRAIALNPGYSRARHWFGMDFLALLGRFEEAAAELQTARDLDPLSPNIVESCGYLHVLRRDYWKALDQYRQLIELDPTFYKGYSSMGRALCLLGRYGEAIEAFEKARSLAGSVPIILSALGQALGLAGRLSEARACLEELRGMAQTQWVPSSCFAIIHLGLGDRESALTWLEDATGRHEISVTALNVHPLYDSLRSEPRFDALLQRIGLLR